MQNVSSILLSVTDAFYQRMSCCLYYGSEIKIKLKKKLRVPVKAT